MPVPDVELVTPILADFDNVDLTGQQLPGTVYTGAALELSADASGW